MDLLEEAENFPMSSTEFHQTTVTLPTDIMLTTDTVQMNGGKPSSGKIDSNKMTTAVNTNTRTTMTTTTSVLSNSSSAGAEGQHNAEKTEKDDDEDIEDEAEEAEDEEEDADNNDETNDNHNREEMEEEEDDDSSSNSNFSDISSISEMSGKEWKPISQKPLNWVQKQIHSGANPRDLLWKILPSTAQRLAPDLNDVSLWRLLSTVLSEPPRRQKLSYVNTFDDVIDLLQKCKNIIVLTGAGVSVSCGIPDFRSSDGIYARLAKDFPDMPDPQAMFDINYFSRDPRPFYRFAREIYPGQFRPSPCHRFIRMLEMKQKLLRNYTQNIDTLEQVAGINNVIECHGSFSTASCTKCKYKCDADSIRQDIFTQHIPVCPRCQPMVKQSVDASEAVSELELRRLVENGIMKPDIVFFGEGLPNEFHTVMANDKDKCDLLIVMGSSLKVRPVALIPSSIPNHVPQILINREQLCHLEFDVELLGDGDVIINQICHRLGGDWKREICFNDEVLKESKELRPIEMANIITTDNHDIAIETTSTSTTITTGATTSKTITSDVISSYSNIVPKDVVLALDDCEYDTKSPTSSMEQSATRTLSSGTYSDNSRETILSGDREIGSGHGTSDYRHSSIDSSKDSGIHGDNNTTTSTTSSNVSGTGNLPPASSFDSTKYLQMSVVPPPASSSSSSTSSSSSSSSASSASLVEENRAPEETKTSIQSDVNHQHMATINESIFTARSLSAGERLHRGTFYHHEGSSSYVFPGAQVSWSTESSEDEDDEEEPEEEEGELVDAEDDNEGEEDHAEKIEMMMSSNASGHSHQLMNEMNHVITSSTSLSPLLTASVEAEMVNAIEGDTTTTTTNITTTTETVNGIVSSSSTNITNAAVTAEVSSSTSCSSFPVLSSNRDVAVDSDGGITRTKRNSDQCDSLTFNEVNMETSNCQSSRAPPMKRLRNEGELDDG